MVRSAKALPRLSGNDNIVQAPLMPPRGLEIDNFTLCSPLPPDWLQIATLAGDFSELFVEPVDLSKELGVNDLRQYDLYSFGFAPD